MALPAAAALAALAATAFAEKTEPPRCLVLFDGMGLARLGLEQAGFRCTGVELCPHKHYLSRFVGNPEALILGDVVEVCTDEFLSGFDAIWASPPCQVRSSARALSKRHKGEGPCKKNLMDWALTLLDRFEGPVWIENVKTKNNDWGILYNAAQFTTPPIQNRSRVIGGRYPLPMVDRLYKPHYPGIEGMRLLQGEEWITLPRETKSGDRSEGVCPAVTASERHATKNPTDPDKYFTSPSGRAFAARFYNRRMTVEEAAFHMGLGVGWNLPAGWWRQAPIALSKAKWEDQLYQGLGNGVPVYMARAFGEALLSDGPKQWFVTESREHE